MGRKIRCNKVIARQPLTIVGDSELINMPARAMLHPYLWASIIFDRKFCRVVSILSFAHSITSSARASNECGTSRPSAFAVLRLIASSYLVGACTGNSAGFSPLRMRSM